MRLNCDPKKAYKTLNWKPKFAKRKGFIKALKLTINWYKENYNKNNVNISYMK